VKTLKIATLIAALSLATLAAARVTMDPLTTRPLDPTQGRALLQALPSQLAGAPSGIGAGEPETLVQLVWTETNHLTGMRIELYDAPRRWIVAFRPSSPETPPIGFARVRYQTPAFGIDIPMIAVDGVWLTQIPKTLGFLPGTRVSAGCWGPSADPEDPSTALYHQPLEI
jgi:hypothetical protein